MIDFILYIWILLFIFLIGWFFILQPKLGLYYVAIKESYGSLIESCRPRFILASKNDQLIFLIFMLKRKYESIPDERLTATGKRYRKLVILNFFITIFFLLLTVLVLIIGSTGNL